MAGTPALTEVQKPCSQWSLGFGSGSRGWKFEIWGLVFGVWALGRPGLHSLGFGSWSWDLGSEAWGFGSGLWFGAPVRVAGLGA